MENNRIFIQNPNPQKYDLFKCKILITTVFGRVSRTFGFDSWLGFHVTKNTVFQKHIPIPTLKFALQ